MKRPITFCCQCDYYVETDESAASKKIGSREFGHCYANPPQIGMARNPLTNEAQQVSIRPIVQVTDTSCIHGTATEEEAWIG